MDWSLREFGEADSAYLKKYILKDKIYNNRRWQKITNYDTPTEIKNIDIKVDNLKLEEKQTPLYSPEDLLNSKSINSLATHKSKVLTKIKTLIKIPINHKNIEDTKYIEPNAKAAALIFFPSLVAWSLTMIVAVTTLSFLAISLLFGMLMLVGVTLALKSLKQFKLQEINQNYQGKGLATLVVIMYYMAVLAAIIIVGYIGIWALILLMLP